MKFLRYLTIIVLIAQSQSIMAMKSLKKKQDDVAKEQLGKAKNDSSPTLDQLVKEYQDIRAQYKQLSDDYYQKIRQETNTQEKLDKLNELLPKAQAINIRMEKVTETQEYQNNEGKRFYTEDYDTKPLLLKNGFIPDIERSIERMPAAMKVQAEQEKHQRDEQEEKEKRERTERAKREQEEEKAREEIRRQKQEEEREKREKQEREREEDRQRTTKEHEQRERKEKEEREARQRKEKEEREEKERVKKEEREAREHKEKEEREQKERVKKEEQERERKEKEEKGTYSSMSDSAKFAFQLAKLEDLKERYETLVAPEDITPRADKIKLLESMLTETGDFDRAVRKITEYMSYDQRTKYATPRHLDLYRPISNSIEKLKLDDQKDKLTELQKSYNALSGQKTSDDKISGLKGLLKPLDVIEKAILDLVTDEKGEKLYSIAKAIQNYKKRNIYEIPNTEKLDHDIRQSLMNIQNEKYNELLEQVKALVEGSQKSEDKIAQLELLEKEPRKIDHLFEDIVPSYRRDEYKMPPYSSNIENKIEKPLKTLKLQVEGEKLKALDAQYKAIDLKGSPETAIAALTPLLEKAASIAKDVYTVTQYIIFEHRKDYPIPNADGLKDTIEKSIEQLKLDVQSGKVDELKTRYTQLINGTTDNTSKISALEGMLKEAASIAKDVYTVTQYIIFGHRKDYTIPNADGLKNTIESKIKELQKQ